MENHPFQANNHFLMNNDQRPFNINTVHKIALIKQFIRLLILNGGLKTKINLLSEYIQIIKNTTQYVSSQINNISEQSIKSTQEYIIIRTIRGYLYPTTYENLLLELIQVLEHAILTSSWQ